MPKTRLSERYNFVESSLDTGASMTKVYKKWGEEKLHIRYRKDENFRRVKPQTLVKLLHAENTQVLLLDLRDAVEFEKNRVRGATSYPAPMISRTMNPFSPEILEYSNQEPRKIIVIYAGNEKVAKTAGGLFFEKGVDNVFVLSGGIGAMWLECPDMIEGAAPAVTRPPTRSRPGTASTFASIRPSTARAIMTLSYSMRAGGSTSRAWK